MKRSSIRSDPAKVREWLIRSRRPLPVLSVRKRANLGPWARAKVRVRRRSGGVCEAQTGDWCTGWAQHVHHVLPRSRGGKDDGSTPLLDVCWACHQWIHNHPSDARALGFLV